MGRAATLNPAESFWGRFGWIRPHAFPFDEHGRVTTGKAGWREIIVQGPDAQVSVSKSLDFAAFEAICPNGLDAHQA